MYETKKFLEMLLLPYTISFFLLVAGVLLLWVSKRRRLAQTLVTLAAMGFFILSYNGKWNFLVDRLEYQYPPFDTTRTDLNDVSWIVVLGGGGVLSDVIPAPSQLHPQSLSRVLEGVRISNVIPHARLLLSGDSDSRISPKVAQVFGVSPDRIVIEDKARDTEGEAAAIKTIVGPDRLVLVTSAIHLPRAMALFNKLGMSPIPAPADFYSKRTNLDTGGPAVWGTWIFPSTSGGPKSDAMIHEYLGLLWAKLIHRA